MFAWDSQEGLFTDAVSAWTAWKSGTIPGGTSPDIVVPLVWGDKYPPAITLIGLQSFNLYSLPLSPAIVRQPQSHTTSMGSSVTLSVRVTGAQPAYQWFFNDTNAIPDATNALLILNDLRLSQSGAYTVTVTNSFGSTNSQPAMLSVIPELEVSMVPAITLIGEMGATLRIDYINATGPTNAWATLATVVMTNDTQFYFDIPASGQPQRYYRVVYLPQ
jgi:hypothetical protein